MNYIHKTTITIQQEITISYNTEADKEHAIGKILEDTNWLAFSGPEFVPDRTDGRGYIVSKTPNIKLVK